jgi:hypothetical protein
MVRTGLSPGALAPASAIQLPLIQGSLHRCVRKVVRERSEHLLGVWTAIVHRCHAAEIKAWYSFAPRNKEAKQ